MTHSFNHLPAQEYLLSRLSYCAGTGHLFWRHNPKTGKAWNAKWCGKRAFTAVSTNGYQRGNLDGRYYFAHRIIWKMISGEDPEIIDHINGDKLDNRERNLRSVSQSENLQNTAMRNNNTSGTMGVIWLKREKRWLAYLQSQGQRVSLGTFPSKSAAEVARKAAEIRYGFHENHGRA